VSPCEKMISRKTAKTQSILLPFLLLPPLLFSPCVQCIPWLINSSPCPPCLRVRTHTLTQHHCLPRSSHPPRIFFSFVPSVSWSINSSPCPLCLRVKKQDLTPSRKGAKHPPALPTPFPLPLFSFPCVRCILWLTTKQSPSKSSVSHLERCAIHA